MRNKIIVGAGALLLLGLAGAGALWWMLQQPLYRPGMLRAGQLAAPLTPPPQPNSAQPWAVEPGVQLHHFAQGQGQQTVLIIHGGPGAPSAEPWPGLAALGDRYRFIYYDQRGCGQSSRPIERLAAGSFYAQMQQLDRSLGLGAQLADIERIRQILGEEQLILIGHSFGGFLATLYAAEFPERVAALVLVAPADVLVMPSASGGLFPAVEARLPAEQRAAYKDWLRRYLDFGTLFTLDEAQIAALNAEFGAYYQLAAAEQLPPSGAVGGWMAQAMYLSMGQRHDYRPALSQISAPTLVIHGDNDLQPAAVSRQYSDGIAGARIVTIAGAGHAPFASQPDAFAEAVGRFLGR